MSNQQPKLSSFFNSNFVNNYSSTPFTCKKSKTDLVNDIIICPICNLSLWKDMSMNNLHIDSCLKKSESPSSGILMKDTTSSSILPANNSHPYNIQQQQSVPGLWIIHDFISEEEELALVRSIDADNREDWRHSSFNGHCTTKWYGYKLLFGLPGEIRMVRQNDRDSGEQDMPGFLTPFIDRLQGIVSLRKDLPSELRTFQPNECNINNYERSQNHYLRPHFDDRTLSGPLLVNLSLIGFARMTYTLPGDTANGIPIELPRRSLQLVTGKARWNYMHEIRAQDVVDPRRVSITWRQSGKKGSGVADKGLSKEVDIMAQLKHQTG